MVAQTTETAEPAGPPTPPAHTAATMAAGDDVIDSASHSGAPVLVADVGSVFTKVYLIADVEGERRLVALGRAPTCGDDGEPAVAAALAHALAQVMDVTGMAPNALPARRLLMTSAAGVPRIALVAPRDDEVRAVAGALESLPVRLLPPLLLEGPDGESERLLGLLEAQAPDAVVIAGGTRPVGADAARRALHVLAHGFGAALPVVILTGDEAFLAAASAATHELPVRPRTTAAGPERVSAAVQQTLAGLVDARLRQWLRPHGANGDAMRGVERPQERPGEWLREAPLASADGLCAATELIAERYDVDVLTVEVGAAHTLAVAARGNTGQRRLVTVARDDLGTRLGRRQVLREAGAAAVAGWLPLDAEVQALMSDARRSLAVPAALPDTVEQLLIEHAFARESIRLVLRELEAALGTAGTTDRVLPQVDLVIGTGGVLASAPRLVQAALMLLDAAQPEALTQLALDRATAMALIGHLGAHEGADAVRAALERDCLLNLGLCIAPMGTGREGEPAIRVEVVYNNRSPMAVDVAYGAIEIVPLPLGERASLKLWPAKEFDVGLGKGSAATPRAEVEGSAVGIVVDARGRPLALPDAPEKRQAKLLQWLQAIRAYPPLSFIQPHPLGA
ncbi:MAG: glutamate mutase L [Chloroflexi bacterium]|nr:glutamate mutase L [Chloroflexota bacterium]